MLLVQGNFLDKPLHNITSQNSLSAVEFVLFFLLLNTNLEPNDEAKVCFEKREKFDFVCGIECQPSARLFVELFCFAWKSKS